jgi:triosephosphate isomerase
VILGHSERRHYFHETDEMVRHKVEAALRHDLRPIVCVGETLSEYEAGDTWHVVSRQVGMALDGLDMQQVVIAYEPVWAIGTGKAATGEGANEVIGLIREKVRQMHGEEIAEETRILYGGSVNGNNIGEFVSMPEIDGALVGGASLDAEQFVRIVAVTNEARNRV